jgi:hypothetical protein
MIQNKINLSKLVLQNITDDQITYIIAGERKAKELATMIQESLGIAKHIKVMAKRQTIIEGPPGVGKSHTTKQTCINGSVQPIEIGTGSTLSYIASKLAYADYWTPKNNEIVVIWDDADDVVFGERKNANIWKNVFMDDENEPRFQHNVNLTNEIKKLEKDPSKAKIVEAMKAYMPDDAMGIEIPMDRFRHIFLTNFDYETMSETKSKQWMAPIVDRFNYNRLNYEWTTAWGWLSHVLLNSQPFEKHGYQLTEEQKIKIIIWIFDKWDKMGNKQTYRTVREMAQYIINEPNNYLNRWQKFIRKV